MATGAFADLPIDIPAVTASTVAPTTGTVDSTSTGALAIKAASGATYYSSGFNNTVILSETANNELSMQYVIKPARSVKNGGSADSAYKPAVGILLPITQAWDIKDLHKATALTFQAKSLTAKLPLEVHISSKVYSADVATVSGQLVATVDSLKTTYTAYTVKLPSALSFPTWVDGNCAALTGADACADLGLNVWKNHLVSGDTNNIAEHVEALGFTTNLDGSWTGSGYSLPTNAASANTLYIKDVVVVGVSKYEDVAGKNCSGSYSSITLDDFATTNPTTGKTRKKTEPNYLGGYWYVFTDSSTNATKLASDSATGASAVVLADGVTKWYPTVGTGAVLTANLEKDITGNAFLYRRYAGWADIGTNLAPLPYQLLDNPDDTVADFADLVSGNTLQAIQFDLYAGAAAGASIDTALIKRIVFKVAKASVGDSVPYQINIPVSQAIGTNNAGGLGICVDVTALAQPSWYTSKNGVTAFTANDLTKLNWEIIIEDQKDATIHTSLNNTIAISNVKLFGIDATDGIKSTKSSSSSALKATYGSSLVLTYSVPGTTANIDVVRLDGSKVASFQAAAKATNLSLPVSLSHGNYLVTVRGNSSRLVSALSVAR
jgi:hypothetical protein